MSPAPLHIVDVRGDSPSARLRARPRDARAHRAGRRVLLGRSSSGRSGSTPVPRAAGPDEHVRALGQGDASPESAARRGVRGDRLSRCRGCLRISARQIGHAVPHELAERRHDQPNAVPPGGRPERPSRGVRLPGLPDRGVNVRAVARISISQTPATLNEGTRGSSGLHWHRFGAHLVERSSREIGVRIALGAQRRSVYRLVLGEASRLVGIGTGLRVIGAVTAATMMGHLLFGVQAWDLPTPMAAAVALIGSALLASYIPARRAASVNPIEILRAE
jgi:hypothetical protein